MTRTTQDVRKQDGAGAKGTGETISLKQRLTTRLLLAAAQDDGMSTAEYAIGTIAAAAFGAVLYTVVTGDSVVGALTGLVQRALSTSV